MAATLVVALALCLSVALTFVGSTRTDQFSTYVWSLANWSLKPVQVRAPVLLSSSPSIWLERGEVAIRRPVGEERARHVEASLEVVPTAGGRAADTILLRRPRLHLNRVWPGSENGGQGVETNPLDQLLEPLQRLAFTRLILQRGQLHFTGPAGGAETVEGLEGEVAASNGRGLTSAKGSFELRGEKISYEVLFGLLGGKDGAPAIPLKLVFAGALLEGVFEGNLTFAPAIRAAGKLELISPSLRRLAAWLGHPLPPGAGLGALRTKGDATWRDGVLAFDNASVLLDGNAALGIFSLNLSRPQPVLDGTLAFKHLDLSPYLGGVSPVQATPAALVQSSDLRAPLLERFDADLRVSAGRISALGLETGKGVASISLRSGKLITDLAELELPDGTASGQLILDTNAEQARYQLKGQLTSSAIGPLLGRIAAVPKGSLEGNGTLAINLVGQGRTYDELIRTLSGEARLAMGPGGRVGINLNQLVSEAKTRKAFQWVSEARGETAIEDLKADVALRDGKVVSQSMRARAGNLAVTGDGTINLAAGQLYLRFLVDTDRGILRGKPESAGLVLLGSWHQPIVKLDLPAGELATPASALVTGSTGR